MLGWTTRFMPELVQDAVQRWAELAKSKAIPGSMEFRLQKCLGEPVKANRWIKRMGQGHQIVVSKFTDGDYLKRMEGGPPFVRVACHLTCGNLVHRSAP
eukprot:6271491-Amphidinium_carterae.1